MNYQAENEMRGLRLFLFVIAAMLTGTNGYAAEVTAVNRPTCKYLLQGEIVSGDLERLKSIPTNSDSSLCLESPGGSYSVGLDIAEYLTGQSITTVLDKDAQCFSSCAIIFMSGSGFEDGYVPLRRMHVSASLGFHAPYLMPENKQYDAVFVRAAYTAGLAAVARMMQLGGSTGGFIPNRVILELLQKGPDQAYLVDTVLKAKEMRIELFGFQNPSWSSVTACNACMNNNEGNGICENSANSKAFKIAANAVQFVFDGVGGEGSFSCAVRLTKAKDGKISAAIAPIVSDSDFPLKPNALAPLNNADGLSPAYHLGR